MHLEGSMRQFIHTIFIASLALVFTTSVHAQSGDPIPSWNNSPAKHAITLFVKNVTTKGQPHYVPPAERIAVFDNDGTLWSEQPMYFQLAFALDRVKALAPKHPEWKTTQPFKAVLEDDMATVLAGGEHALIELVMATHAGNTTEEFSQIVKD